MLYDMNEQCSIQSCVQRNISSEKHFFKRMFQNLWRTLNKHFLGTKYILNDVASDVSTLNIQ